MIPDSTVFSFSGIDMGFQIFTKDMSKVGKYNLAIRAAVIGKNNLRE